MDEVSGKKSATGGLHQNKSVPKSKIFPDEYKKKELIKNSTVDKTDKESKDARKEKAMLSKEEKEKLINDITTYKNKMEDTKTEKKDEVKSEKKADTKDEKKDEPKKEKKDVSKTEKKDETKSEKKDETKKEKKEDVKTEKKDESKKEKKGENKPHALTQLL